MTVAGHIIKVTPNRAIHNIGLNSCISEDNSDSLIMAQLSRQKSKVFIMN